MIIETVAELASEQQPEKWLVNGNIYVPDDPANPAYRCVLSWIMAGNTPLPFDPATQPEPEPEPEHDCSAAAPAYKRFLVGLEPERLSATVIRLFPGVCSDGHSSPSSVIESPNYYDIDMLQNGLGGLDVGSPVAGENYFVYVLKNPFTEEVGAVISKEISVSLVTKPAGFTLCRKLPWGFVYFSAGIEPFHLSGWPLPFTRYTGMEDSSQWACLTGGTATTWQEVDLSAFVPDSSRLAYLLCKTQGTGAGEARLRVLGAIGQPVGNVHGAGQVDANYLHIRLTSTRKVFYKVSGGASLSIYVAGYSQTERP